MQLSRQLRSTARRGDGPRESVHWRQGSLLNAQDRFRSKDGNDRGVQIRLVDDVQTGPVIDDKDKGKYAQDGEPEP